MIPKMIPVSSSNVAEIGYDETNQEVYVRFINNAMYIEEYRSMSLKD